MGQDSRAPRVLDAATTLLAIIDLQEAFRSRIGRFDEIARRAAFVANSAQLFGVPIAISEQNPRGLGPTARELGGPIAGVERIPKLTFNALCRAKFQTIVAKHQPVHVV